MLEKCEDIELKFKEFWPDKLDVQGAMVSLLRIQNVYMLPVIDIANGILSDKKTHARLTVDDLYEIGKDRLETIGLVRELPSPDFALAVEWLEAALQ